ncbi:hypothetical protein MBLNU457_1436t2 [Dothideomycetes sp. NU457]
MKTWIKSALFLTSAVGVLPGAHPHHKPSQSQAPGFYSGWDGIRYMFSFGDSYSTTEFNDLLQQPNPSNPLGNPAYPGITSSNGPNWVDFLTTTYNQSYIETVNLAVGGATVDRHPLISQSFKHQLRERYLPTYSGKAVLPWASHDTLFAMFFGINDIGNEYKAEEAFLASHVFKVYNELIDELYQTGARNFLFMNVPPVDRSPWMTSGIPPLPGWPAFYQADIADFNARLIEMVNKFARTYSDVTVFMFDTHGIFSRVLDEPCAYAETCSLRDTAHYCENYQSGTPDWYTFDERCGISVDQYFWLNSAHPTFRIHNATAKSIAAGLSLLGRSTDKVRDPLQIPL